MNTLIYFILGFVWVLLGNLFFNLKRKQLNGNLRKNVTDIILASLFGPLMVLVLISFLDCIWLTKDDDK